MDEEKKEKRKYFRYDTEMRVYFQVNYDLKTKVKFKVLVAEQKLETSKKHSGFSKNISVEGLCFVSKIKLEEGDVLSLEVYVPNSDVPVQMEGEVRWSQKLPYEHEYKDMFHTAVKLVSVGGQPVDPTIHYDQKYKVIWGIVLESVFGNFLEMIKRLKEDKK